MILTCPNCGTQYVVKDGAIPPEGRQVRCAACKHSWHQEPDADISGEGETPAAAESETPAENVPYSEREIPGAEEESLAGATLIEPRTGPEAEERADEEALVEGEAAPATTELSAAPDSDASTSADIEEGHAIEAAPVEEDWKEPPDAEASGDMFSPFAENGEVQPRRKGPLLTFLIVAVIVVALAAAFWFFAPPDLKAKLGLGVTGDSPLALVTTHMDRQRLESGNELLTVTGRVINPTAEEQDVPPLQAQLRSKTGKVVYSWTIAPPARTLPAGASASFNSAEVNVPPGGDELTITLGDPKA
ncbi:MAG: zinc-ribbon domain-containing protein [Sphingomicrobium sp.]